MAADETVRRPFAGSFLAMRFDSPLADRLTAIVFLAIGGAMLWGGWTMDRLEIRQIHPSSIPGLVPMFLGGALMFAAVLLYLGASRAGREQAEPAGSDAEGAGSSSMLNFGLAAVWSTIYALALVDRIPFGVATGIYIAGFALWFGWPHDGDNRKRVLWAILSLFFAGVMATAISVLFRYGFLVRLP